MQTREWARQANDGSYVLTGHKWFCSAPMSDAFLTLAQAPDGLTCFLVPRWRPDGVAAVLAELGTATGRDAHYDAHVEGIKRLLGDGVRSERTARGFARDLGLGLQGAALRWSAPAPVFDGCCSQRLDPGRWGFLYGDLGDAVNQAWLIERSCRPLGIG